MNADFVSLSQALADRVLPAMRVVSTDWSVVWFKPEPVIEVPLLCVGADPMRFADYTAVPAAWFFRLTFYLDFTDQEPARLDMSTLTGRNGPVIAALESPDITDALFALAGLTVSATTGRGMEPVKERRGTFLEADIGVQLNAD